MHEHGVTSGGPIPPWGGSALRLDRARVADRFAATGDLPLHLRVRARRHLEDGGEHAVPFCTNCGHSNPYHARFCSQCGTRLEVVDPPTTTNPVAPGEPVGETTATISSA